MEPGTGSTLETEFSLLEEEFFGNTLEERETNMSDTSVSDSESTEEAADDGAISRVELREVDVEEVEAVKKTLLIMLVAALKKGERLVVAILIKRNMKKQECLWLSLRMNNWI